MPIDVTAIASLTAGTTAAPAAQISGPEWARLAAGHGIYLTRAFLASVEASPRTRVSYLTARTGGRLAGLLPAYLVDSEANPFYDISTWLGADAAQPYPALLLGTRTGYYNGLLIDRELPARQADLVLDALLEAARQRAMSSGARSMAFCHLDSASWLRLQQHQLRRGRDLAATTWLTQVGMSLPLRPLTGEPPSTGPTSEDDYLAWLGSDRARKLRRQARTFAQRGYEVISCPLHDVVADVGPLLALAAARHDSRPVSWTAYAAGLASQFGPAAHAFLARIDGANMACSIGLVSDDAVHMRGYGAADGLESGEYFELGYRLPLRYALRLGVPALEFGPEGCAPKLLRGATPIPLWTVVLPVRDDYGTPASAAATASQRQAAADSWRTRFGVLVHPACAKAAADLGRLPGQHTTDG